MKYVFIGIAVFIVVFYILMLTVPSWCVYTAVMKRKNKEKWSRENTSEMNPIIKKEGDEWYEAHKHLTTEVHIVNDGLNLYGEYYDLGYDRCVMVLPGRTDTLRYGYYFAKPYEESGYNILVLDPRAHGKSDGVYNTAGLEERKDVLAWAKYIHENFGVRSILFHAICIGAAGGMYVLTDEECPEYIEGMIAEGMYSRFSEIMKNHLIERKKPTGILIKCINMWMRHYTGHSMYHGPLDVIENYRKPLLMIHGREDKFSLPKHAEILYNKCPSQNKSIVWYDEGAHSMLRPTDTQKYDGAIKKFINKNFQ